MALMVPNQYANNTTSWGTSSSGSDVIIGSGGVTHVVTTPVTQTTIQNALSAAHPGDVVQIPACNISVGSTTSASSAFSFAAGISVVGAGSGPPGTAGITELHYQSTGASSGAGIFAIDGGANSGQAFSISGITFVGQLTNWYGTNRTSSVSPTKYDKGISVNGACRGVRIHDNYFTEFTWSGITFNATAGSVHGHGYAVVYNNVFYDIWSVYSSGESEGYGSDIIGPCTSPTTETWTLTGPQIVSATTGTVGGITGGYIYYEDNHFERVKHTVASVNGSIYIERYNTILNCWPNAAYSDMHGLTGATDPEHKAGSRWREFYNNSCGNDSAFNSTYGGPYAVMDARGGAGMAFNNTILSGTAWPSWAVVLYIEGGTSGKTRPVTNQVGNPDSMFFWNNATGNSGTFHWYDSNGSSFIIQNNDFYYDQAPATGLPNSPTVTSYTPLAHPHPSRPTSSPSGVTSIAVSLPNAVTSGNFVAGHVGWLGSATITGSIQDDKGNTYTKGTLSQIGGGGTPATPAFVRASTPSNTEWATGNVATIVRSFPSAVGNGNFVIGHVSWDIGSPAKSVSSVTDNGTGGSNTWDIHISQAVTGDNQGHLVFFAANITNAPTTVTVNFSVAAQFRAMEMAEYSGIATASPLDVTTSKIQAPGPGTGAGAINSGATAGTANANEMQVGLLLCSNPASGDTTLTPSGANSRVHTLTTGNTYIMEIADVLITNAGTAAQASFTGNVGTRNYSTIVVALKPAGSTTVTSSHQTFFLGGITNAPKTVTVNFSAASFCVMEMAEYALASGTYTLDANSSHVQAPGPGAGSNALTSNPSTSGTTAANELELGYVFSDSTTDNTFTAGTGFTIDGRAQVSSKSLLALEENQLTAQGATAQATFTAGVGTGNYSTIVETYSPPSGPPPSGPQYRQYADSTAAQWNATPLNTVAATFGGSSNPNPVALGSFVVGHVSWDTATPSAPTISGISDNATGATNSWNWTRLTNPNTGDGQGETIFYAYNIQGSPSQVKCTFSSAANFTVLEMVEYTGVLASADPFDVWEHQVFQTMTPGSGTGAIKSGTGTATTQANDLAVAFFASSSAADTTVNPTTDYTNRGAIVDGSSHVFYKMADKVVTNSGTATSATFTGNAGTGHYMVTMVAFKAASASGPNIWQGSASLAGLAAATIGPIYAKATLVSGPSLACHAELLSSHLVIDNGPDPLPAAGNLTVTSTQIIAAAGTTLTDTSVIIANTVVRHTVYITGPEIFPGQAVLNVSGNLIAVAAASLADTSGIICNAIVVHFVFANANLTASGNLIAATRQIVAAQATLTGQGAMPSSGSIMIRVAAANLVGIGIETVNAIDVSIANANLSGAGNLAVSAITRYLGVSTIVGQAALSAIAIKVNIDVGPENLLGIGSLNAIAFNRVIASALLGGTGSLTAAAVQIQHDTSENLAGTSNISALVVERALAGTTLQAASSIFCNAVILVLHQVFANATLNATSALNASVVENMAATAMLGGDGNLVINAVVSTNASATLSGTTTLVANSIRTTSANATLSSTGSLTYLGAAYRIAVAQPSAQGLVAADSFIIKTGQATLAGTGNLAASPVEAILVGSSLVSTENLLPVSTTGILIAGSQLTGESGLVADAQLAAHIQIGQCLLAGSGQVAASAAVMVSAQVTLASTGILTTPAVIDALVSAALAGSSNFLANGFVAQFDSAALAGQSSLTAASFEQHYGSAEMDGTAFMSGTIPPAQMAGSGNNLGIATFLGITTTTPIPNGSAIVVIANNSQPGNQLISVTDSIGNNYTVGGADPQAPAANWAICQACNALPANSTITLNFNGLDLHGAAVLFTRSAGVDLSPAVQTGTATNATAIVGTPGQTLEMLIGIVSTLANPGSIQAPGWTLLGGNGGAEMINIFTSLDVGQVPATWQPSWANSVAYCSRMLSLTAVPIAQVIENAGTILAGVGSAVPVTGTDIFEYVQLELDGFGAMAASAFRFATDVSELYAGNGAIIESDYQVSSASAVLSGSSTLFATAFTSFGTAELDGTGTASQDSTVLKFASIVAFTGAGQLQVDTVVIANPHIKFGNAILVGASSLVAPAVEQQIGTVTLAGVGSEAPVATSLRLPVTATLQGVTTLAESDQIFRPSSAFLSGNGVLSAVAVRMQPASASLFGQSSLMADSARATAGNAILAASGNFFKAMASLIETAAANLNATSSANIAVRGIDNGVTELDGVSNLTAQSIRLVFASAICAGSSSLAASAAELQAVTASLTGDSTAEAFVGQHTYLDNAEFDGSANMVAGAVAIQTASATVAGDGEIIANAGKQMLISASLAGDGEMAAFAPIPVRNGTSQLDGQGILLVNAVVVQINYLVDLDIDDDATVCIGIDDAPGYDIAIDDSLKRAA